MTRDDIIRMGVQARLIQGVTTNLSPFEAAHTSIDFVHGDRGLECLERFVSLVAYHARATVSPIMIDAKSIDPDLLRGMLEKAAPMTIVPMPPSDEVAAAVAAEREACAKVCDARKDQSRNHLVRSGLTVAALDIRARGASPQRCTACGYQHGHAIGCVNNPVDIAINAMIAP